MPRILSRHDLVPQTKQNYYGYSYNGSFARSRSTTPYSPTMSTVSSVDTNAKTKRNRNYEGLSYSIEERQPQLSYQSRNDIDEGKAGSDNNSWGYFVDFTSPVIDNGANGRKSLSSHSYERS